MDKEIATAISDVMNEVGYIQKRGTNTFHNYKFTAVGDLLAKLQPAMVKSGLVIIQNEVGHVLTDDGNVIEATYEFTLLHKSGVIWDVKPRHTGMSVCRNSKGGFDDKAINKCHTAARKYFLLSLFQIPTGEEDDPDAHESDVAPERALDSSPRAARAAKEVPGVKDQDERTTRGAKEWGAQAILDLAKVKTLAQFKTWHSDENRGKLTRLQQYDSDLYEALHQRVDDLLDQFNPISAG